MKYIKKVFLFLLYSTVIGIYSLCVWVVYKLNQPCKEDYGMLSFQEEITTGDWNEFKLYFYMIVISGYVVIILFIYLMNKKTNNIKEIE